MIALLLLSACEIGLVQGNPEYYSTEEKWTEESLEETTEGLSGTDIASSEEIEESYENIFEEEDVLEEESEESKEEEDALEEEQYEEEDILEEEEEEYDPSFDMDGDGYSILDGDCNDSENTIFPGNPELSGDGIDNDCDGVDGVHSGIQCAYNIEMVCGPDGWVGRQLRIETEGGTFIDWASACQNNSQGWSYGTSEALDLQLSPGQSLTLSLCSNNDCSQTLPVRDLAVIVRVNGTLIEEMYSPDGTWGLNHICPL
jgi:hypothetical protein